MAKFAIFLKNLFRRNEFPILHYIKNNDNRLARPENNLTLIPIVRFNPCFVFDPFAHLAGTENGRKSKS